MQMFRLKDSSFKAALKNLRAERHIQEIIWFISPLPQRGSVISPSFRKDN